ncbi:MAG: phosphoribosylglycinamide formyltransferase [Filomicrobium sp.]
MTLDADGSAEASKKRVAVLISGRGSNMMSLVEAARASDYPAEIVAAISNRPDAGGLDWAREQGLTACCVDHKAYETRDDFDRALHQELVACGADIVACAGFMRLMTPWLVDQWRDRMINIHPSLLPSFRGLHTHQRALDAGVRFAGCTVHVVRAEVDTGPILGQAVVPVIDGDTADELAARVLKAEHHLYPHALALFAADKYDIDHEVARLDSKLCEAGTLYSPMVKPIS